MGSHLGRRTCRPDSSTSLSTFQKRIIDTSRVKIPGSDFIFYLLSSTNVNAEARKKEPGSLVIKF